jgi:hypothetical protein
MRLGEFTDPKDYAAIVYDIEDLVNQLERIWPRDDLTFVLDLTEPQAPKAQSNGRRVSGIQRRSRHAASQRSCTQFGLAQSLTHDLADDCGHARPRIR